MAYLGRFDGSQATHASPAMAAASKQIAGGAGDPSALPTSTKWSVLSSRVEGLVAELSEVVGKQDAYCVSQSHAEGPAMAAVREKMLATPWGELWTQKKTMFSYGEEMSTDPLEAMLLKQLVFMAAPRRVLEIGMFVGYGSVAMLEGSATARVVSLEIDPYLKGWLAECLESFPNIAARHEVMVGPALESLPKLEGKFDMVFVDANKAEYRRYVELILERKLLAPTGVLVCDNVLYNGYPYVHQHFDAQPARREFGNAIRDFNQWVADHPSLEQVVLPVRDGISIIRQRIAAEPLRLAPPARAPKSIPGVKELHTFQRAPNHTIVDIFMREKGLEDAYFEQIEVWINLDMEDNRDTKNLAMNPQGSIPWFVLDDGRVIAETIAMCEYIEDVMPENPLIGRDAAERATVRMWQRRMEEHYCYPAFYGHRFWTSSSDCPPDHFMKDFFVDRLNEHGGAKMIPAVWKDLCEWARNRILWLERVKQEEMSKTGRPTQFIAGDFFSMVDIQVYTVLWFFAYAFPHPPQRILEELEGRVPWVKAWYDRCHARPSCAAAREDREKDLRQNKTEPKKHLERLQRASKEASPVASSSLPDTPAAPTGNLVHHDHTWRINRSPSLAVPAGAVVSDCSVEPSVSEYADEAAKQKAWVSHSVISFDYRVVEVPTGRLLDPACDALIFGHLAPGSPERAEAMTKAQRRLVVIDEAVHELHGDRVTAYFEARGVVHEVLVLPMVEENKSMDTALKVAKKMKQFNIDRRTEPVLAIGGGVCLDVVGFAAAIFRRRTPYIRVPTTALSYVDASVGAKNGVNFAGSKNRLGTYVPPCAALLDPAFFGTQAHREVANGVGEMAKMAIMKSPELYGLLEEHGPRLVKHKFAPSFKGDDAPGRVLQLSIETMVEELAPNLWENSLDRLVDFGHATGQDLEMAALGTEQELLHGESVAVDMALMTVLSQQLGLITEAERDRTLNMLRGCQVPVWSPVMTYELFTEAVDNRVKNSMGQRFPLPAGIGKGQIINDVSEETLQSAFRLWEQLCGSAA